MSARRLNSGELLENVDAEDTIATLFSVITPAPAVTIISNYTSALLKSDIYLVLCCRIL